MLVFRTEGDIASVGSYDSCDVCNGNDGNQDCNGDCFGDAFIDDCGVCVGGNTSFEEGFLDLGCGCNNPEPMQYCYDADNDGLGDPENHEYYCLENLPENWILDCSDYCISDSDNDLDGDGICGDVDVCPYDAEDDADGDGICGDVDDCPYDAENDGDDDGICGDVDKCPYASDND